MNILIVGGAGFVGTNLVRRCVREQGNRVVVVDSLEPRLRSAKENLADIGGDVEFIQGDISDEQLLSDAVRNKDVIYNCAAQTSHPLSIEDPIFDAEVNCLGNLRLLEAARRHNKEAVLIYPSSSTVIGRAVGDVIDESHGERPLDIYSAHKGVAEKHYAIYNQIHDLRTVVLRFPNLYGPYGKGYPEFGFLNYFIHLAASDQDITVYGSGEQTRNVLYVEDAVDALYDYAFNERLWGGVFFVAHHDHPTIQEVAQTIVEVFEKGKLVEMEWPELRRRIDVARVLISSARFRDLTHWVPRYSLRQGLEKTRGLIEG